MNQKPFKLIAGIAAATLLFYQCSKNKNSDEGTATASNSLPQLPATPYNYNVTFPQHIAQVLPQVDNTPSDNPITNDGATLGRVLFYDKNLSKNNRVSCASCHKQEASFSDDAVKSMGFAGGNTARHSMPTLNVRFYRGIL